MIRILVSGMLSFAILLGGVSCAATFSLSPSRNAAVIQTHSLRPLYLLTHEPWLYFPLTEADALGDINQQTPVVTIQNSAVAPPLLPPAQPAIRIPHW